MYNLSQICPIEFSFLFSVPVVTIEGSPDIHAQAGSSVTLKCSISEALQRPKSVKWQVPISSFMRVFFGSSWVTHFWKFLKMNNFYKREKKSLNITYSGFWLLIPNRVRKKRPNILKCRKDNLFAWPASDLLHKPMRE